MKLYVKLQIRYSVKWDIVSLIVSVFWEVKGFFKMNFLKFLNF